MTYHEFIKQTKEKLEEYLGNTAKVREETTLKNNSVRLRGISIMPTGGNLSPTIYLEPYYQAYQKGTGFHEIILKLIEQYENHKPEMKLDIDFFMDYECVKARIMCKLISFEKNTELLKEVPHKRYLDLAVVFYCMLIHDEIGSGTILIHQNHLEMWGVTVDDLYQAAECNTRKLLGYQIRGLEEMMREMLVANLKNELCQCGDENTECPSDEDLSEFVLDLTREAEQERIPMYVLSNKKQINGASCMLFSDVLSDFADQVKLDFFIIPSSIHELILVPTGEQNEHSKFTQMVREVNATQLETEEILADHVYYYSREKNEILSL